MTTTNKPKWVEALESAEEVLQTATDKTPEEQHALNLLAQSWTAISWAYRDQPTT